MFSGLLFVVHFVGNLTSFRCINTMAHTESVVGHLEAAVVWAVTKWRECDGLI